ncbi:TIGR03936 family radical SAM-associated protein [Dehalococcoidales bacterium]|nr:TIGR03936 family radical SAM-associated protein [Dehalococcoidales bacterium]
MLRLRIRFCRGEEIKFISHLDIIRLWQRALHRAGIPLAYSEGFSPHPRISLAAPLPVGVTSEAELMDIICTRWVSPHFFTSTVSQQLPPGIKIIKVQQIALNQPSLQSQVGFAEYKVELETEKDQRQIESALTSLLSEKHLPWQHQRDTGTRSYDLRPLIDDLWLTSWHGGCCTIGMRLRCDSSGSGRPEQVILALGFTHHPHSIHRTKLILRAK